MAFLAINSLKASSNTNNNRGKYNSPVIGDFHKVAFQGDPKSWNGGTVERWNGGTVERWNGGTEERRNGGMVERRNGGK